MASSSDSSKRARVDGNEKPSFAAAAAATARIPTQYADHDLFVAWEKDNPYYLGVAAGLFPAKVCPSTFLKFAGARTVASFTGVHRATRICGGETMVRRIAAARRGPHHPTPFAACVYEDDEAWLARLDRSEVRDAMMRAMGPRATRVLAAYGRTP